MIKCFNVSSCELFARVQLPEITFVSVQILPDYRNIVFRKGRCQSSFVQVGNECIYGQIKVNEKVKFTLEQVTKAQRGSRGIALLFP
jgi:hypothetical protein